MKLITRLTNTLLLTAGLMVTLSGSIQAQNQFPYQQDFEDTTAMLDDWTAYNVMSNENWTYGDFGGDHFPEMNGFQADTNSNDWLISPVFDLSGVSDSIFLTFFNTKNFSGGSFELKVSTDYDGVSNPDSSAFTWQDLSSEVTWSIGGYSDTFSGKINLKSFKSDSVFIAFHYQSTPSSASLWRVDDIRIFEDPSEDASKPFFTEVPYQQDFENTSERLDDWLTFNVMSTENWGYGDMGMNHFAEMNGFEADTNSNDWLVSPGFDLANVQGNVFFSFDNAKNFSGGTFQVKLSTDYDGESNPKQNATWTDITQKFKFSNGNFEFVNSGHYNLSSYKGDTVHIAFHYQSSPTNAAARAIDDVEVKVFPSLKINEILANNQNGITDEANENDAWVELYNPHDSSVNLSNYTMTNSLTGQPYWHMPDTTIGSKDYMLVWADNDTAQGSLHTNFELSASGDSLYVAFPDSSISDKVGFGQQTADSSLARETDGEGDFMTTAPTPGETNEVGGPGSINLSQQQGIDLEIFPNPSQGQVNLVNSEKEALVTIVTPDGQEIREFRMNTGQKTINLDGQAPGLYLVKVRLTNQEQVYTDKILLVN